MKKGLAWLPLYLLSTCGALAQNNLVYNGDFELYDTCPTSYSTPTDYQINHCLGWTAPTMGTSDYYNTCAVASNVWIPNNVFGYQETQSGSGYLGFGSALPPYIWDEYVQGRLPGPLIASAKYKFSFYYALSDFGGCTIPSIGILFSSSPPSSNNTSPLNLQVTLNTDIAYPSDTTTWMYYEGEFIAQGGERHITIGHFYDSLSPDFLYLYQASDVAYFYVDNLKLELIDSVGIPNFITPNNDGINDLLSIPGLKDDDHFMIYNRWGNCIADITGRGWDGTSADGKPCSDGVYYYIILRKESESIRGFVQLFNN